MRVSIIAAIAENNAIGKDNDLLWHLPEDMKFFTRMTKGHTVIMGRKNYESIPHKFRPLPNRKNIVLTRNISYTAEGAQTFNNIEDALKSCHSEKEVFVIGGSEIYNLALERNLIDTMFLTKVHGKFDADAFFPEFDEENWDKQKLSTHPKDEKHAYAFEIFEYNRK
ncbi:MAG: dihydrofolate reductase [Cryomorphaceae bacterium]|nr:dihydrofolate reductase [Flavobacteriales bacterium]